MRMKLLEASGFLGKLWFCVFLPLAILRLPPPSASHFPGEPQPGSDSVFSELNQIPPSTLLELTSDLEEMR